jgi:hypothetical protein
MNMEKEYIKLIFGLKLKQAYEQGSFFIWFSQNHWII